MSSRLSGLICPSPREGELEKRRDPSFFCSRNAAGFQHYRGICLCGNGLLSIYAGRICAGTGVRLFHGATGPRATGFRILHVITG